MPYRDHNGLEFSAPDASAAHCFNRAVNRLVHFEYDVMGPMRSVLSADSFFPIGEALRAYLGGLSTDAHIAADHAAIFSRFQESSAGRKLTDREDGHLRAAGLLLCGNLSDAGRILGEISKGYPHDILALAIGHQIDYMLGATDSLRDRIGTALPAWREDEPNYGAVLGMYSFALEESGHWARAEDVGTQAVQLDPANVWAIHAVAHTFEMRARFGDGAKWLDSTHGQWTTRNQMRGHIWWHYCLYLLEKGEVGRVLEIFDEYMAADKVDHALIRLLDGSSLLWRLHILGFDVQDRFGRLAELWTPRVDKARSAFNDIHAVMCYLGSADFGAASALIARREAYIAESPPIADNVAITTEIGLPVCKALVGFHRGRFGEVLELLYPIRQKLYRCGGSHAQRDVVHQTLLEAAIRGGRRQEAEELLAERIAVRPDSPLNWVKRSQLAEAANEQEEAKSYLSRARQLISSRG
jgi:tetratricopeptide (TPR) repeat protein